MGLPAVPAYFLDCRRQGKREKGDRERSRLDGGAAPFYRFLATSEQAPMNVNERIHAELVKAGVRLAASLPDDWVNGLIRTITAGNEIRHIPVGREAETVAICAGAFFGGVRSVAIMGNTGLLTCTGEMATLCLRHMIPVFCIVSARGSIDDHKVYQEVQGRRTVPLLAAYDFPYQVIDKPDEIERIPDAYEWHRLQKRPFILFLTKRLLGVKNA